MTTKKMWNKQKQKPKNHTGTRYITATVVATNTATKRWSNGGWNDCSKLKYTRLEASSGPPKQPMDRPGPQGQQQHTTSWFVEAIHRTRSFGGDATVLADYALTTTTKYTIYMYHLTCQQPTIPTSTKNMTNCTHTMQVLAVTLAHKQNVWDYCRVIT